jgi:starch synthase
LLKSIIVGMPETSKKILFVNSEIFPYLPESEIATVGRYLPQGIQERKKEIRSFMPRFGCINERKNQLHEVIRLSGINIVIGDVDHPLVIKVASIPAARIQVYFIDNDDYFSHRQMACDADGNEYADNGERAVFFARGVLETVKKLRWIPDIIHCQGWMSAIIPLYIKTAYRDEPWFANTKVVTSLFSEELKKSMGDNFRKSVEFRDAKASLLDKYADDFDFVELEKLAIDYSDGIVEAVENVNENLINHALNSGKPVLRFPGEDNLDNPYDEFYDRILGEE